MKTNFFLIALAAGCLFQGSLNNSNAQELETSLSSLDSLLDIRISSAAKYEQTVRDAPASVSIITSDDILNYGYRTLDELLSSVRGFYTRNDRNYIYVGTRGFSLPTDYSNKILILINGLTLNDSYYGEAFFGNDLGLNIRSIERVEVVRGPGSSLYGTGAMLAVVNIVTKKGSLINGMQAGIGTGSWGRRTASLLAGREWANGLDLMVSGQLLDLDGPDLYSPEYDNPATNHGITRSRDWEKSANLAGTLAYKDFHFQAGLTKRKKGIPTGAYGTLFNSQGNWTRDNIGYFEGSFQKQLRFDQLLQMSGYYGSYYYHGEYPSEDDNWLDETNGRSAGVEMQYSWFPWQNNHFVAGAEFRNLYQATYKEWTPDQVYYNRNTPYRITSFFLQNSIQLSDKISLIGGLRHDSYSNNRETISPRATAIFKLSGSSTLKLLYGKAFRVPNPYETTFEDVDEAKSNPSLRPEKINTHEIIWEQQLGKCLIATLNLYDFRVENLITQVEDPEDGLLQFRNGRKVRGSGLEMELRARFGSGQGAYLNYNYNDTGYLGNQGRLFNSPAHTFRSGAAIPLGKHLIAALEAQYDSDRLTVYYTRTDPYWLTNLNFTLKPWENYLTFQLLVRNLLNARYEHPGGLEHIQHGLRQDGRQFTLTAQFGL